MMTTETQPTPHDMNCPSCAAPIPVHGVVCTYCGQRIDVDLQGSGQSSADSDGEDFRCPDCDTTLQPLLVGSDSDVHIETFNVCRCSSCLGIFVQRETLDLFLKTTVLQPSEVNYQLLNNLEESNRSMSKGWKYRPCPACRTLMNRKLHGKRSGVIVDSCRDHGIWLDAGELRQLMEWTRAGGPVLCQDDYAREKQAKSIRERRRKISENFANKNMLEEISFNAQNQQQSPSDIFEAIAETIKDLFAYQ